MKMSFQGMVLATGQYTNKQGKVIETIEFLDLTSENKFQLSSDIRVEKSAKFIPTHFDLDITLSGGQFGSKMFGHITHLDGKKA